MKKIALGGKRGQDKFMLCSNADFKLLNKYRWWIVTPNCYAQCFNPKSGKKEYAHILIMNPPKGVEVDHRNINGLDNQRKNLRLATSSQNKWNTRKSKSSTSGYKGVSYRKDRKLWETEITKNYKRFHLGLFKTKIEAAKIYDLKAKELFGKFAKLNF